MLSTQACVGATQVSQQRSFAMFSDRNFILSTDSYKHSHFAQLPPNTTHVTSYVEARSRKAYSDVLFFGLQAFLRTYLEQPVTQAHVDIAADIVKGHGLPFNRMGWERIVHKHAGRLPLVIQALPEGVIVPVGTPLVQVTNTDPECAWLPAFVETALLRSVWYPTSVATRSRHIKRIIRSYLERTCDNPGAELPFKLHDFGARGVSSGESAAIGGAAHLVNFMGSDTLEAIMFLREHYGEPMAGFSIPAAEHSTITSWGRERETDAYRNMLTQFAKPGAIVAVVSDSYDLMHAVNSIWGGTLKDEVERSGATIVIRPDSGDPRQVPVDVVAQLAVKFGTITNGKGFRVLPKCVRVIQGDGINEETIGVILLKLQELGYSAENIAFGMGGELLQTPNRDTLGFAQKTCAAKVDDAWVDVFKEPKTDSGKTSKRGRQAVVRKDGAFCAVREDQLPAGAINLLREVWRNGRVMAWDNLAAVRARAEECDGR
jgi:nicotinamide phosphoribosyltransferase